MRKLFALLSAAILLLPCLGAAQAEHTEIAVYARLVRNSYTAPVGGGSASVPMDGFGSVTVTNAPPGAAFLEVIRMEGEAREWISDYADGTLLNAFHIYFLDGEGTGIPADGVRITLTLPELPKGLRIRAVRASGAAVDIPVTLSGDQVSFVANGSPYYALVIPVHEHSFTDQVSEVQASEATCTEPAKYYVRCDACAEYTTAKTVPVGDPLGHDWDGGKITTEPTCEKTGVKTFVCQRDSSHTKTEDLPALGHSFTNYVSDGNATCRQDGTKTAKCDHGCGKTHTVVHSASRQGHHYADGVCIRCGVSRWNPGTGDEIGYCVAVLFVSAAVLGILFDGRRRKKNI